MLHPYSAGPPLKQLHCACVHVCMYVLTDVCMYVIIYIIYIDVCMFLYVYLFIGHSWQQCGVTGGIGKDHLTILLFHNIIIDDSSTTCIHYNSIIMHSV